MVFGLSDDQKAILMYLYDFADAYISPPDDSLSVAAIAASLQMTQRRVRDELEGLEKKLYTRYFTHEGRGYSRIMPGGKAEVEKIRKTESEWRLGRGPLEYRRKKTEG
jgi:hypothetical protein